MTMERLYKQAFWSCFGGLVLFDIFVLLLVDVILLLFNYGFNATRLSVFIAFGAFCFTVIAFVWAWLAMLYANVMDRKVRVQRLVSLCRLGRWAMLNANPVGRPARFLWKKALVPFGVGLGWRLSFLLMCAMPDDKTELQ